MNKGLEKIEIEELMLALGFHHLDSRARWKLKFCDTIMVTDAQLRWANSRSKLAEQLTELIDRKISTRDTLIRKKKILLAFFKS